MITRLLLSMLVSFLLTEAVELGCAWLLGLRRREGAGLIFLANLMTNPAVVLISTLLPMRTPLWVTKNLVLGILEVLAWLAEALLYAHGRESIREMLPMRVSHLAGPYLTSGILNACSFGAGLILDYIM